MQVVAKKALRLFWLRYPRSKTPLSVWHATVEKARWSGPNDIKAMFGTTVDFLSDNRVIFDIGGNKYRLIIRVSYKYQRVLIKFIGTHDEYDKIDPETVSWISGRSKPKKTTSGRSPK
jgi:mRNA interferase HigB